MICTELIFIPLNRLSAFWLMVRRYVGDEEFFSAECLEALG